MNIIIFGGAFNPIHNGHLFMIEEIKVRYKESKILIIPTNISPHKDNSICIESKHRLNMLKLAVVKIKNVLIENCEIERSGTSYSIDTVRYIKQKYKLQNNPGLILGDDLAVDFEKWKNYQELAEESQLIIVRRKFTEKIDFKYKHTYLDNYFINISSSLVRERIKNNKTVKYLIPEKVLKYIERNNLYK